MSFEETGTLIFRFAKERMRATEWERDEFVALLLGPGYVPQFDHGIRDAEPFEIGDGGAWTDLGVLFAWGRLVFEIFGDRPTWSNQLQAVFIGSVIEKRMPPALPEDPR